ncbi:hypothetical protein GCM10011521_20660 [Arenimonas soli]|uniref:Transmembrane protein n=2 Tax=Arenimonas soli TaxID=2269504 RepID=A0ABQ1HL85_9GAMM|nr:hypothetical protein GCM10011521_20660 [Arenimonas soli]
MSPSTVGMAAPFRWLRKAFDVGRRNPKALFGAIALVIVVVVAMTMAQTFLQVLTQGSMSGLVVVMVLMTAVNWVVMPPLVGGLFRVVDATDRGLPVVASDVFNAYGRGQGGKRLVLVSLVYSLAYVGFAGLMLLTPLGQFFREYFAIALATPVGGEPDMAALQALMANTSPSAFLWLPVVAIVMFTWLHASMLALATAALREVDVATAVVAGAMAALRNFLPLLGFMLVMLVGGFAAMLLVGLVLGLLMALLAMASPVLVVLVMFPLMLLVMLAVYAMVFAFYYHGWRDIFGLADAPAPPTEGALEV